MRNIFQKKIRVAMVAPSFGDIGGPEVVSQNLTNALLKLGVEVTLFAPADWKTKAKHVPSIEKSIWNMEGMSEMSEKILRNYRIASQVGVLKYQNNFDIVHLHSQKYAYAVAKNLETPSVISFHNKIAQDLFEQLKETKIHTVTLSNHQKGNLSSSATIHNGVPVSDIEYSLEKGKYLMFVGRLNDQKGVDTAIEIAIKANKKLILFGRIGNSEERQEFYKNKIEPYLENKNIVYKGEVSHDEIYKYFREAEALLFPIRRPEVCPMTIGEALATGTPVIGTRVEPLPELLNSDEVSFLSNDIDELVEAVKNADRFDRKKCRKYAEDNFDSIVMAKKYLALYKEILKK